MVEGKMVVTGDSVWWSWLRLGTVLMVWVCSTHALLLPCANVAHDACQVLSILQNVSVTDFNATACSTEEPASWTCPDQYSSLDIRFALSNITGVEVAWNSTLLQWSVTWEDDVDSGNSTSNDPLYIVSQCSLHADCSLSNWTSMNAYFFTPTPSINFVGIQDIRNISIAVSRILTDLTVTTFTTADIRLGAIRNISVSGTFFDDTRQQSLVNVTWAVPNDGVQGPRLYNVTLCSPDNKESCDIIFNATQHNASFIQFPMLFLLQFTFEYGFRIWTISTSSNQLSSQMSSFPIRVSKGPLDIPGLGRSLKCSDLKLHNGFQQKYAARGTNLTVYWGLWSFDRSMLPVLRDDLLASLGDVSMDIRLSTDQILSQQNINPFLHPTMNKSNCQTVSTAVGSTFVSNSLITSNIILRIYPAGDFEGGGKYSFACSSKLSLFAEDLKENQDTSASPCLPALPTTTAVTTTISTGSTPASSAQSMLPAETVSATSSPSSVVLPVVLGTSIPLIVCVFLLLVLIKLHRGHSKEVKMQATTFENPARYGGDGSLVPPLAADEYEISPKALKFFDILGSGSFGVVFHAILLGKDKTGVEISVPVAVKTLMENATESDRSDLLQEISHMKDFCHHPHLVKLIGCCTLSDPIYLIAEWVPYGNLKELLRETHNVLLGKDRSKKQDDLPLIAVEGNAIKETELYGFAHQIADGMEYLASMRFVHRDLATRNILVGVGKQLKVADFGMTRDVYDESTQVYVKQGAGRVPIRWMALESLLFRVYTHETDVWSFGVVLWEICTFAALPYADVKNTELVRYLRSGGRLAKRDGFPDAMYGLMQACWFEKPSERPTFSEILEILADFLMPIVDAVPSPEEVAYEVDDPEAGDIVDEWQPWSHHGAVSEEEAPYIDASEAGGGSTSIHSGTSHEKAVHELASPTTTEIITSIESGQYMSCCQDLPAPLQQMGSMGSDGGQLYSPAGDDGYPPDAVEEDETGYLELI